MSQQLGRFRKVFNPILTLCEFRVEARDVRAVKIIFRFRIRPFIKAFDAHAAKLVTAIIGSASSSPIQSFQRQLNAAVSPPIALSAVFLRKTECSVEATFFQILRMLGVSALNSNLIRGDENKLTLAGGDIAFSNLHSNALDFKIPPLEKAVAWLRRPRRHLSKFKIRRSKPNRCDSTPRRTCAFNAIQGPASEPNFQSCICDEILRPKIHCRHRRCNP